VRTRVVQSYSKEFQFLPTCCEQRVTYLVIGISDLELESTFLEQSYLACKRHAVLGADQAAELGSLPI
jgi:hypothetical protein